MVQARDWNEATKDWDKEMKYWNLKVRPKGISNIVLKCEISKDNITAMGEGEGEGIGDLLIIAKEFTFVEGDEYFEKEE